MVEIKKWQLRDTRLNVQSPFALPRISTPNFCIFKGQIIICVIALSNDNQWTVGGHAWLPYKTNQFHMQHDFLFSSKRPMLVRVWEKINLSAQSSYNYCWKVLSMKNILINIKTKKCTPKSVLLWEFASVYILSTLDDQNIKFSKVMSVKSVIFNSLFITGQKINIAV